MSGGLRQRLLTATFDEVAASGFQALTIEAVAARAGSSRATIYRHFPGGREELISATIESEVADFFDRVTDGAPGAPDVVGHVAVILARSHRMLGEHAVLQRILHDEAEAFLPSLAVVQPVVHRGLAAHFAVVLADAPLRGDLTIGEVADHAARMVLSYIGTPGSWDLEDPEAAVRVARTMILSGVMCD